MTAATTTTTTTTTVTSDVVQGLQAPMNAIHDSGVNQNYKWRVEQLQKVDRMLEMHSNDFEHALAHDLGKESTEACCTEMLLVQAEIQYILSHLHGWMQPESTPSPLFLAPCISEIHRVPLRKPGVLIIGPSNYPCALILTPLVGALAGGNPVLVKPSELCPHTAQAFSRIIPMYFPPTEGVVQVIQGDGADTAELCKHEWGMIFFTGSQRVGKLVAAAAGATLTPTVLELGGKCPAYVDEMAPFDLKCVANRIIWGKTINAGQTCVAPDYLLIHRRHATQLLKELQTTLELQFGPDPSQSELGRIVNTMQAQRLFNALQEAEQAMEKSSTTKADNNGTTTNASSPLLQSCKVLCGGSKQCNPAERYIAPTLLLQPPLTTCPALWQEEIFGPILPIRIVDSRQEAMDFINSIPGTPLAMYVFTSSARVFQEMIKSCPAAAYCRNECTVHAASLHLPLAGLGSSGYGAYHGKHSFYTFTHPCSILYRPCLPGTDYNMLRYHPLQGIKGTLFRLAISKLGDVPVLHTRRVMVALLGLAIWKWMVPVPWQLQNIIPDALVWLASQIRRL